MTHQGSGLRKEILQKIEIIKLATNAAAQKISKEKLDRAGDWLKEIHEQVKKLEKLLEDNIP